jgi:hypothetical protein
MMGIGGSKNTDTVTESFTIHPSAVIISTEYVINDVGVLIGDAEVVLDKKVPGDH